MSVVGNENNLGAPPFIASVRHPIGMRGARPPHLILGVKHGGLGDHLQLSTIPELAHNQEKLPTYFFRGSDFRNEEIRELVWGSNPFVLGETDESPNAGSMIIEPKLNFTGNWISNWEYLHGLKPEGSFPKIYYGPSTITGLADVVVVDLTSITLNHQATGYGYNPGTVLERVQQLASIDPGVTFAQVCFTRNLNKHGRIYDVRIPGLEQLNVESLTHYADVLASVKGLIGLHSGAIGLASSVRGKGNTPYVKCLMSNNSYFHPRSQLGKVHMYPNVEYEPLGVSRRFQSREG